MGESGLGGRGKGERARQSRRRFQGCERHQGQ